MGSRAGAGVLVAVVAAALCAAGTGGGTGKAAEPSAGVPAARGHWPGDGSPAHSVTDQWAGYMTFRGTYKSVSAAWVHPAVDCSHPGSGVGVWVGLGHTATVQQAGTIATCGPDGVRHHAWYEMYPLAAVHFEDAPVRPGDRVVARVSTEDARTYTLTVVNETAGWTRSTVQTSDEARAETAEVFVEAYDRPERPLADFGDVRVMDALVNDRDLRAARTVKYEMGGAAGRQAVTSDLDAEGRSFTVGWRSAGP